MKYSFKRVTSNVKTGPIPVTMTERASCPDCGIDECYAKNFPIVIHWDNVTRTGMDIDALCHKIKTEIHPTQLWRHNVAGDQENVGGYINRRTLEKLVAANKGRQGFTYTHHNLDLGSNSEAVRQANADGFTINASCNNLEKAIEVKEKHNGIPVVTIVESNEKRKVWKEGNHRVIRCPATYDNSKVQCVTCKLCANPNRKDIIAFPAHGTKKKKLDERLKHEKNIRNSNTNS